MPMRLSSKEINVRKVKGLMRDVKASKLTKMDVAKELNNRFDRMNCPQQASIVSELLLFV